MTSEDYNFALKVLKQVYSQGDDYFQQEDEYVWYATFSNDYPLQHGTGWTITITKADYSFYVVNRVKKVYGEKIQETINNLKKEQDV